MLRRAAVGLGLFFAWVGHAVLAQQVTASSGASEGAQRTLVESGYSTPNSLQKAMAPALQVEPLMQWTPIARPDISPLPHSGMASARELREPDQRWSLMIEDRTLYRTLSRWSSTAGWQLIWDAERDFRIESDVHLTGQFLTVLGIVLDTLRDSDYPLQAIVNSRTQVVRIVRHMDHRKR